MRNLNNELKDKIINYDKLLEYGFVEENNKYVFKNKICNEQFEMIVNVSDDTIYSKLIELENNEEYILVDVVDATGEFIGKLREEYENHLEDIIDKCTIINVFKSTQAKEIIEYVTEKYNDELEFLWKKFDNNAIWRNKKNNKWYAALLIINESKIGINSDKIIEIIDLRYQKESIKNLVDNNRIFPGYHMNKNSWITIKLDGTVETQRIFELIDNSYDISLRK